jgi:hypothetical protein
MKRVLSSITEEKSYLLNSENIDDPDEQHITCYSWFQYIFSIPVLFYNRLHNYIHEKRN